MAYQTIRPLHLLFLGSALQLGACTLPGTDLDQDSAGTGSAGTGEGASATGGASGDGTAGAGEGSLEVRGGISDVTSALRAAPGYQNTFAPAAAGCPFIYDPNPCSDPACADHTSVECSDAVNLYCSEHPDDPGCQQGPPPGGTGGTGGMEPGGTGGGGDWACDVDPTYPPCEVCLDPTSTQDECNTAWNDHCMQAAPDDPWCGGGGGPDDVCQGSPDDPPPCEVCRDPNQTPDACDQAWHDFCDMNQQDPACMGSPPESVHTPTSMSFNVMKIQLSQDADNCSDPITVAEVATPEYIDFFANPVLMTGELPPDGEYPCVIITMTDWIKWSLDDGSVCAGDHTQDVQGVEGEEEIMTIYLSTAGVGKDEGDQDAPFHPPGFQLDAPFVSGDNVLYSVFQVGAQDIVEYRPDNIDRQCDMQPPSWGFDTVYVQ